MARGASPSGSKSGAPSGGRPGDTGSGTVPVRQPTPAPSALTPPMPTGSIFGAPAARPAAPAPSTPTPPRRTTTPTSRPTPAAPVAAPSPDPAPAAPTPDGAEQPLVPETPNGQPTPSTPTTPVPDPTVALENRRLFGQLSSMLDNLGLAGLYTVDGSGAPSGWLWDKIVNNQISDATFDFEVEQTDAFKQRFPAVAWLQAEAKAGRSTVAPTARAVREYENDAKRLLQGAQLPPEFYDNDTQDLQGLMMKGISIVELEQRVGQSWSRVQSADPAIRQAFSDFYGVGNGDSALAAFFLDPTNMTQNLERMSKAAYTAGRGARAGIGLSQAAAERVATMTTSDTQIEQGLGELGQYNGLFTEDVTETQDLAVETTGIDAAFGGDAAARNALERRLISRQANRGGGGGGAVQTQRGLIGTGNA